MPPTSSHFDATMPAAKATTLLAPSALAAQTIGAVADAQSWPLLDVSLVTFNSSGWLPMFFASLLSQDYPTNRIRVLATDNGSSDASFEMLHEFARQHGAKFAATVVTQQENRGFGAGHNVNLRWPWPIISWSRTSTWNSSAIRWCV